MNNSAITKQNTAKAVNNMASTNWVIGWLRYFPDTYQVFVGGLGWPSGFSHYVKYIRVGGKSQ
jgi:hypothetical protein